MSNGIAVQFVGNVTRDPELRYGRTGTPWVTFSVAVNRFMGGRGGSERQERTTFRRCKAFNDQAEHIAESITKGMRVWVTGIEEDETWTANDGSERREPVVIVDEVGPSLRWATAAVTRRGRNGAAAPVAGRPAAPADGAPVEDEGFDPFGFDEEPAASSDEAPF